MMLRQGCVRGWGRSGRRCAQARGSSSERSTIGMMPFCENDLVESRCGAVVQAEPIGGQPFRLSVTHHPREASSLAGLLSR
jgi:hypothetical protein